MSTLHSLVMVIVSMLIGILLGYWLYPMTNKSEQPIVTSQTSHSKPSNKIQEKKVNKKIEKNNVLKNHNFPKDKLEIDTKNPVVVDNPINPIVVDDPKDLDISTRREQLYKELYALDSEARSNTLARLEKADKIEDNATIDEIMNTLDWKEPSEQFSSDGNYDEWAYRMQENIYTYIFSSDLVHNIHLERVNCNSEACEIIGKDDKDHSWDRIVNGMEKTNWWDFANRNGSSVMDLDEHGRFFYTILSRH